MRAGSPWILGALAAAATIGAIRPSRAVTFYVRPGGDDGASGLSEGSALASLQGARDAIRRLKAKGPLAESVRVVVADGAYAISETFVLEPRDSGTARSPIVYEATPGEPARRNAHRSSSMKNHDLGSVAAA